MFWIGCQIEMTENTILYSESFIFDGQQSNINVHFVKPSDLI